MTLRGKIETTCEVDDDGLATIHLWGPVIVNVLDTQILELIEKYTADHDQPKVILNLRHVGYLDSFSFSTLIKVREKTRKAGGDLVLCSPNSDVRYLFELTNFLKAVPVYANEQDAKSALRSGTQGKRLVNL
jgi:anti-anti-sigma factor